MWSVHIRTGSCVMQIFPSMRMRRRIFWWRSRNSWKSVSGAKWSVWKWKIRWTRGFWIFWKWNFRFTEMTSFLSTDRWIWPCWWRFMVSMDMISSRSRSTNRQQYRHFRMIKTFSRWSGKGMCSCIIHIWVLIRWWILCARRQKIRMYWQSSRHCIVSAAIPPSLQRWLRQQKTASRFLFLWSWKHVLTRKTISSGPKCWKKQAVM